MADNYMTYNDAVDVLTPYAEKINTIKPEPITWAAYQLLTTAQKEAKRYVITDYPSPTGYVNELADLEDVDINTSILVDGQMLVYDSTTQKWKNKTILENSLTSTATDKALAAAQGKALQDSKVNISSIVNTLTSTATDAPLSGKMGLYAVNEFTAKTTTFNPDGSITETDAAGNTLATVFTSDTVITQTLKDSNNVTLATKTTIFSGSTITEALS